MSEIWGAITAVCTALTVLTLLFLYVVRAEIDKAMAKMQLDTQERFVSSERFEAHLAALNKAAAGCPITCGLKKHTHD